MKAIIATLVLGSVLMAGCQDKAKQHEQAQLQQAMALHCQKTLQMSQDDYISKYMVHNGNTDDDRQAAIDDYQKCLAASTKR